MQHMRASIAHCLCLVLLLLTSNVKPRASTPSISPELQDDIVGSKGQHTKAAHQQVPNSALIASLVRSTAFGVQQQLPGLHQHGSSSCPTNRSTQQVDGSAAAAVLSAAQQRWQALVLKRLHAAQMFLPDVPLAAVARTALELDNLRRQGEDSSK
jgi:hypothetical protein